MEQAMAAVEQTGTSIREAAKMFSVPPSTLYDRVSGKVSHGKKSGPIPYLTFAEEEELISFLKKCADIGYPHTKPQVLALVQRIVDKKQIGKTVSNGWWQKFALQHKEVTFRCAVPLSYARAMATDPDSLDRYYDLLEDTLRENGIFNHPMHIFNCDESGLPLNPKILKVVSTVGSKNPHHVCNDTKLQITILACTSASGITIPPFVIFDRKTLNPALTAGEVAGTLYGLSHNGWMDSDLFLQWFERHFLLYAPKARPLLLLLDGHSSHYSPEVIRAAAKEKVILFTLPPNTTHLTQPLDKGCFGPLKSYWKQACHEFYSKNPGYVITRFHFSSLFAKAWYQAMTSKNIVASFCTTGVYPFDRKAISLPHTQKRQSIFQPDLLPEQTGLAYIPMYSPVTSRSLKCRIKLDSAAETSLLDETKQDMQSVRGNLERSFSDGDIQGSTATTAHYMKPTTAINRYLVTPVHPSLHATKKPKSSGRVLTSLENMKMIQEKELEKKRKR